MSKVQITVHTFVATQVKAACILAEAKDIPALLRPLWLHVMSDLSSCDGFGVDTK